MKATKFLTVLTALAISIGTMSPAMADSDRGLKRGHDRNYHAGHHWHHKDDRHERRSTHYTYRLNSNQPVYYYKTGRNNPVVFVPSNRVVVVSNSYSTPYAAVTPLF